MRTGIVEFVSGDSYYFCESGAMQTGWIKNGNKYYYANDNGTLVKDSWKKINGKWYYFDGFSMVTGLYELHGVLYHFDSNGVCLNP